MLHTKFCQICPLVPEKKIFEGFLPCMQSMQRSGTEAISTHDGQKSLMPRGWTVDNVKIHT